ncbi:diaminobutyrate--2-oxoglutarate transaminase [uncultured Ruegeria sp.]|uniref:diaminobutyrate--2-oxoglutarate transaminase n=1 Tax=uncultured Ruegeria sp. TaxID=259304 RepID=UPI0026299772|nr:diaminobutyrate--2-oxoglutarate transaminase [uncultured Ruegeria sp.]
MYAQESQVFSYCRVFPEQFAKAQGCYLITSKEKKYIDFLSGCGSMNYGHNHPILVEALAGYIRDSGIVMSMDMATESKEKFIDRFDTRILKPRNLSFKLQFTGPTGANAVEAAIKIARKATQRTNIVAFTNGFHGCSLGALSLTGNRTQRSCSQTLLNQVTRAAYDGYFGSEVDTAEQLSKLLDDSSSGVDSPAAFVVELIQGEGGLNAASQSWLQKIKRTAERCGAKLIIDDVQAGCGRSGTFFSFEDMGIVPDMVVMAKGISGFGLPMSLLLLNEDLDVWEPGEHNGTFRGNNYAFVTAEKALTTFWTDNRFADELEHKISYLSNRLAEISARYGLKAKGRGFMQGIDFVDGNLAAQVRAHCFDSQMIIETCGPKGEVLKLLPPLTIEPHELDEGLSIIEHAISRTEMGEARLPVTV